MQHDTYTVKDPNGARLFTGTWQECYRYWAWDCPRNDHGFPPSDYIIETLYLSVPASNVQLIADRANTPTSIIRAGQALYDAACAFDTALAESHPSGPGPDYANTPEAHYALRAYFAAVDAISYAGLTMTDDPGDNAQPERNRTTPEPYANI